MPMHRYILCIRKLAENITLFFIYCWSIFIDMKFLNTLVAKQDRIWETKTSNIGVECRIFHLQNQASGKELFPHTVTSGIRGLLYEHMGRWRLPVYLTYDRHILHGLWKYCWKIKITNLDVTKSSLGQIPQHMYTGIKTWAISFLFFLFG